MIAWVFMTEDFTYMAGVNLEKAGKYNPVLFLVQYIHFVIFMMLTHFLLKIPSKDILIVRKTDTAAVLKLRHLIVQI